MLYVDFFLIVLGLFMLMLLIRQSDKVRAGVSSASLGKAAGGCLMAIIAIFTMSLPGIREMAVSAGMEDFALLLGMLGIVGPIIVGIIVAAVSARTTKKRREAEELQLQKDEQARRLEAKQRAEEQRKLGEAKRLEAKRQAEEKRELQETARLQEEARRERQQEEIRKRNEGEEKRLREEREQKQAENPIQPRDPALMAMLVMQHERAQQETDPDARSWLMRDIQRLQQRLGDAGALAEELIGELAKIVRTAFLAKSCPRCHENKMALIEVSPNAKSIEYVCIHCERRQRAAANSPDAGRAKSLEKFIIAVLGKVWFKTMRDGYRCTFSVPEAVMPYQQAARPGQISVAIRGQVWRRDNGRCVQCGNRESLHFDHIIPVAKGGATIVSNLQLLCQSCNLSKGAKI